MPQDFLHDVETIEVSVGPRPIRTVKSSVIGLVGTAPIGPVGAQTLCLSDTHAAQFGPQFCGFTIPQALDAIFDHGAGTVLVINVLDPATHKTAVAAEPFTLNGDTGYTEFPALQAAPAPVVTNSGATATYVAGTDYVIEPVSGKVSRLAAGTITAGQTLKISYTYADPTKVLPADVIGAVNGAGVRTAMQSFVDSKTIWGYYPKLLLIPAFCTLNTVAVEMLAMVDKLRGVALIDAPIGTTYAEALLGRGPAGEINFATSSDRAALCYPHLKAADPLAWRLGVQMSDAQGQPVRLEPMSQRLAGLISRSDNERGYWWSPSNQEFAGVVGVEHLLSDEEANELNANGIVTYRADYGTGILAWGNRTGAWPANTDPKNFLSIRRTADILHESIEMASRRMFLDTPITDALIDAVTESVNALIRLHVGRGALIDGKCSYDPTKNPPTELALGRIRFDLAFMPPPPAERVTFESYVDIDLLRSLGVSSNG